MNWNNQLMSGYHKLALVLAQMIKVGQPVILYFDAASDFCIA